MRIATGFLAALLMVVGASSSDDQTPRGLFLSKQADAIKVRIVDDMTDAALLPDKEFRQGDTLRIEIEPNFEAYLYIVNLEIANGETNRFLLFPNPEASSNKVKARETIPARITFDERPAQEVLEVIASHDPLDFLESALKSPSCSNDEKRCALDISAGTRLTQLLGDRKPGSSQKGGIFSVRGEKRKEDSIRTRDIILSQGKDKKDKEEKDSYVALPKNSSAQEKLKSGEILAFEIRLKHI